MSDKSRGNIKMKQHAVCHDTPLRFCYLNRRDYMAHALTTDHARTIWRDCDYRFPNNMQKVQGKRLLNI